MDIDSAVEDAQDWNEEGLLIFFNNTQTFDKIKKSSLHLQAHAQFEFILKNHFIIGLMNLYFLGPNFR